MRWITKLLRSYLIKKNRQMFFFMRCQLVMHFKEIMLLHLVLSGEIEREKIWVSLVRNKKDQEREKDKIVTSVSRTNMSTNTSFEKRFYINDPMHLVSLLFIVYLDTHCFSVLYIIHLVSKDNIFYSFLDTL